MPTLHIQTNVTTKPADIHKKMVDLMVDMYQKDKKYLCTKLELGCDMTFAGTSEPCALVQTFSIGKMGPDVNPEHSRKIAKFLETEFGVPGDRHYIVFNDLPTHTVGYAGTAFNVILGK